MQEGAEIEGRLFDGDASRPHEVSLRVDGDRLRLSCRDPARPQESLPISALRWQEALGARVRSAQLADGRRIEVATGPALDRLLARIGHRESIVARWQRSAAAALCMLLLLIASLYGAYRWGLPALAEGMAAAVPGSSLQLLDRHLLDYMREDGTLAPSRQPAHRIEHLTGLALQLLPASGPAKLLVFDAPRLGANAFALPGGTIVLTDDLLQLARNEEDVAAVVAHELGHVAERHGLRQLLQTSMLAVALGLWSGDFSSTLTLAGTVLIGASYSRQLEQQADALAARRLQQAGLSPSLLAAMLQRLGEAAGNGHAGYLSSHPPTPQRIEHLRRLSRAAPHGSPGGEADCLPGRACQ